jgi:hypothetical protein
MRTPAAWLGGVALSLSVAMAGAEGQSAPASGRAAGQDAARAEIGAGASTSRVNVAYGTALDKVLKVLAEVAHGHPDVAAEPVP